MTLSLHILTWLRAAGDNLTPETQLRQDLRLAVAPVPTGAEITEALNHVADSGWAVSRRDKETGIIKWSLTDEGHAQLDKRKL